MHIYGDLQRRPNNRRSLSEKIAQQINILIVTGMLCTLIVGTVQSTIRSTKTFNNNLWMSGVNLELTPSLRFKTEQCSRQVRYDSFGYGSFTATISGDNLIDALASIAVLTRTNLILAFIVLFFAYLNRMLVWYNMYFLRYRNYVFRKSTLTTIEFFIAIVGIVGIDSVERESAPIRSYLEQCGVTATRTLPFGSPLNYLYVFYAFEFGGFFISTCMLFVHGIRKPRDETVRHWRREQYEIIKAEIELDERKNQIVVAQDGTLMGNIHPEEVNELRYKYRDGLNNHDGGDHVDMDNLPSNHHHYHVVASPVAGARLTSTSPVPQPHPYASPAADNQGPPAVYFESPEGDGTVIVPPLHQQVRGIPQQQPMPAQRQPMPMQQRQSPQGKGFLGLINSIFVGSNEDSKSPRNKPPVTSQVAAAPAVRGVPPGAKKSNGQQPFNANTVPLRNLPPNQGSNVDRRNVGGPLDTYQQQYQPHQQMRSFTGNDNNFVFDEAEEQKTPRYGV